MQDLITTKKVDIPSVPEHLIRSLEQIRELDPVVMYQKDGSTYEVDWYKVYTCDQQLTDWVVEHFPVEVELVEYIISTQAIDLHVDLGRNTAYNYVLDTGGDNIVTEFYSADRSQLIDSIEYTTNAWYVLNVGLPHQVKTPQSRPRIIISVTPSSGVTYKF
jgi:hypothetical protein